MRACHSAKRGEQVKPISRSYETWAQPYLPKSKHAFYGCYMKPELSTTPRSAEDRKQGLDNYLVKLLAIRNDAVILMRTDHQASIKTGKAPNHILHFLLCIPTLGFWVIVWILISMSNKVRTDLVSVDEFGNIHTPYGNYF